MTECNGESRPSDNGGRGGGKGGWSQKNLSGLRASVWWKMMGGWAPRPPPLDLQLEWSRNSCNNPVSSACSLSLLLCSKPLTQLVSWHERKEKRESEHENRNKKTSKKVKPKTWWGLCSFFWLWKNLKAYNLNNGLFVSSIHLLSRFFCKAG